MLWSLSAFIIFSLAWMEMQAVIKSAGDLVVSLGGYLAVRFLIPDRATVPRLIKALAVVCVIQGAFMVSEQFTYMNVFSSFGANPPTLREGHIRSEGAMGNLWAGALAGIVMPLFVGLWSEGRSSRIAACAGLAGATAMVFATHASTVVVGLWREPLGPRLLASAPADATGSLGAYRNLTGITFGHAWAGLVPDRED